MKPAALKLALLFPLLASSVWGSIDFATNPNFTQGFPFDLDSNLEYEQIYSAQIFENAIAGPVVITGVTFFDQLGVNSMGIGSVAFTSANFEITFYTTTTPLANTSDELGANTQTFLAGYFVGTLGGAISSTSYTFNGPDFEYDPSQGNLVMDVIVDDVTATGSLGFDLNSNDPNTERVVNLSGLGGTGQVFEGGLETSFQIAPEPGTWFLLFTGLAGIGARRRGLVKLTQRCSRK